MLSDTATSLIECLAAAYGAKLLSALSREHWGQTDAYVDAVSSPLPIERRSPHGPGLLDPTGSITLASPSESLSSTAPFGIVGALSSERTISTQLWSIVDRGRPTVSSYTEAPNPANNSVRALGPFAVADTLSRNAVQAVAAAGVVGAALLGSMATASAGNAGDVNHLRLPGLKSMSTATLAPADGYAAFGRSLSQMTLEGRVDEAGMAIYDNLTDILKDKDFDGCNELLKSVDVESTDLGLLVALVMGTWKMPRDRIPHRDRFYDRVYAIYSRVDKAEAEQAIGHLK